MRLICAGLFYHVLLKQTDFSGYKYSHHGNIIYNIKADVGITFEFPSRLSFQVESGRSLCYKFPTAVPRVSAVSSESWRRCEEGYLNRVKHQLYLKCHWYIEDIFQECALVRVGSRAAAAAVEMSYRGLALKSHLIGVFPQVNKKVTFSLWWLEWNAKNRWAEVPEMSRRNNFHHILCQLLYLAPALLWETWKGHQHVWLILCQHLAENRWHRFVIKDK